jgi:hypothetical protein
MNRNALAIATLATAVSAAVAYSIGKTQDEGPDSYINVIGKEATVVARGEGRLKDSASIFAMPKSFSDVADPDKLIQCLVTPCEECSGAYARVDLGTRTVEVKCSANKCDARFTWLLIGTPRR